MKYSLGGRSLSELIGPNLVDIGPDLVKRHGYTPRSIDFNGERDVAFLLLVLLV